MNSDPSPKPNEHVRMPRENQTSFKRKEINQQLTEQADQENSCKQNLEIRSLCQLILVCAVVVLMMIVVIERNFIKDDMLLTSISSMFSFILGYLFTHAKPK